MTRYYIPRRMMSIAPYQAADDPSVVWTPAGEIQEAEVNFPREVNDYRATDLSGDTCLPYVALANQTATTGTLTIQMMNAEFKVLLAALSSALGVLPSGAAPAQTLGTMAVGNEFRCDFVPDLDQSFEIVDSDTGPTTLIEGTHWQWVAKKAGVGRIIDVGSLVQPFIINYNSRDVQALTPMSDLNTYWMVSLAGANELDDCKPEREIFYRLRMTEATLRRLHEPEEQKDPVAQAVGMTLDRDPARSYQFGLMEQTPAVAA